MLSKIISRTFSTAGRSSHLKPPVRVAVTGAAGQIGYAAVFRIAKGDLLGPDQPVILHLIDLPAAQQSLQGLSLELNDMASPLLHGIVCTDSMSTGFKDVDVALLVGAKPRGPGQERGDLLKENGKIFVDQGKALNDNAKRTCKILVVGNPANTNALIAATHAPGIPRENFTAMSMLDHLRGLHQLAHKTNARVEEIKNFCIWGNHSPTMYPDITHATVKGKKATSLVDEEWVGKTFIPTVQQRGAEVIKLRKLSSAASAANAAIEHIRQWALGNSDWTSFCVHSKGNQYGIDENLIFSFPVTTKDHKWTIVNGLKFSADGQARLKKTEQELLDERKFVEHLLK